MADDKQSQYDTRHRVITSDDPEKALAINKEAELQTEKVPTESVEMQNYEQQQQSRPPPSEEVNAPWSIWSLRDKKLIMIAAGSAAILSPMSGFIYFPALNAIARDLRVSDAKVNISVTTYLIFQGLAPSFVGNLSDELGRRPAYISCFIIYTAANIGLAIQNNYAALLVLRLLQSAGSSGTVALTNAVAADLVTSAERGKYVSYISITAYFGPTIGPVIGGLLTKAAGWHFIFWFLIMLTAVVALPILFYVPETCRKIVGDGSIPPQRWNRSILNRVYEKRAHQEGREIPWDKRDELARKRRLTIPNPFGTIKIIFQKEAGFALVFAAIYGCIMYAPLSLMPSQFSRIYNFNELQISLCYIPLGAGTMLAAFTRGPVIDSRFKHHAKRLGIEIDPKKRPDLTDFPIERARLEVALPTVYAGAFSLIAFGWTVEYRTNLSGPLILLFVIGFCTSATFNSVAVLLIDIYPGKPATAGAANNLLRCWVGAGATALVVPLINAMGVGWTCTLYAAVILAFSPMLWWIMRQGPKWRRHTREKKRAEQERKNALADNVREKGIIT